MVRKSGEEKPMAMASASGIMPKAAKTLVIETNCSKARPICSRSRWVRSEANPPAEITSAVQGMSEKRQRKKTTSLSG